VLAFVAGLVARYPIDEVRVVQANGEPAILLNLDGREQLVTVDIRAGRIHEIFAILNPDKLMHV